MALVVELEVSPNVRPKEDPWLDARIACAELVADGEQGVECLDPLAPMGREQLVKVVEKKPDPLACVPCSLVGEPEDLARVPGPLFAAADLHASTEDRHLQRAWHGVGDHRVPTATKHGHQPPVAS
jgi:hypothetical protein